MVALSLSAARAGQIVITRGGTYTFAIGNNNPNIPAVEIKTTELVRLYRCTIWSMGLGIQATEGNASVQIDSCTIWIVPPGGDAIQVHNPGPECLVSHCSISGATNAIEISDWRPSTNSWVSINWNRITNCQNDGHAILLNGIRSDPNIAIGWNEITNQFGRSKPADAINIYQSSGMPGAPILVHNNFVQGVAPPNPSQTGFTSSGIVTDGITHGDASRATANVEIAYNQVVGCPTTGIALAMGLMQIAHHNTIVSSGLAPNGQPYAWAWLGICIEGDSRYQPAAWLKWMQLQNNVVGCNDHTGSRTDLFLWYPDVSDSYCQGNVSLHDGPITLADEQVQWTAWKQKIASNHVTVGP
jgi:chitinase